MLNMKLKHYIIFVKCKGMVNQEILNSVLTNLKALNHWQF